MKKNGILTLILILWILLFNTFFAFRVEELMTPWVTTTVPHYSANSIGSVVPLDCQYWDDMGTPVLYQVYEGMMWESGTCVRTLDPEQYETRENDISVKGLVTVVQYSTKPPRVGERVNIIEKRERQDDTWLMVYPEQAFQMKEFDKNITVEAQCDTAALLSVTDTEQPFLEKNAISRTFVSDVFSVENTMGSGPQVSVYSLLETKQFFSQLPILALLISLISAFLFLWIYSCILAKRPKRNKKYLTINSVFALILTAAVPVCIRLLNFPSSLLPQNNIVELEHYSTAFSEIFDTLKIFADKGNQMSQEVIDYSEQMLVLSVGIVIAGIILTLGVIALEKVFFRKKSSMEL